MILMSNTIEHNVSHTKNIFRDTALSMPLAISSKCPCPISFQRQHSGEKLKWVKIFKTEIIIERQAVLGQLRHRQRIQCENWIKVCENITVIVQCY